MANTKITAANIDSTSTGITLADLTVNGDITGTLATAAQPNITSVGTLTGLNVNVGTNNVGATFTSTDQEVLLALDDSLKTTTIESNNGILIFGTNGASGGTSATEAMRIDRNGNVGIGGSPAASLDVTSAASDAAFLRSSNATTSNVYITNTNATTGNTANLYFAPANNVAGSQISSIAIEDFSSSANRTADLAFSTRLNGTMSERMRIDSVGEVSIKRAGSGGTGVLKALNLNHAGTSVNDGAKISFTAGTSTEGAGIASTGQALNSADLRFYAGGNTERMRIRSDGGVGINQAGYASTILSLHNGTGRSTLIYGESGDANCDISLRDNTSTQNIIYGATGNNHIFKKDSAEHMRIDAEANISFGTQKVDPNWSQFFNAISGNYGGHLSFQNNNYAVTALGNNYYINNSTQNERVLAQPTQVFKLDHQGNFLFESAASGTAGGTFSFTEKMRISSEGNLLINTTSKTSFPTNKGAAAFGIGGEVNLKLSSYGTTHTYQQFILGGSVVGSISATTSSTSYNTSSDYRLKENVDYDFNALDRVAQLKPARFNFIADADKTVDGFLAHEVQDIVPEAITGEKDGVKEEEYEITPAVLDDDGNVVTEAEMGTREVPDYQGIDQSKLVPLLTKAIQEQQTIIDDLKSRIEALEG